MEQLAPFEKAQALFVAGRTTEAVDAFSEAIDARNQPLENPAAPYLGRGAALMQLERYTEAIDDFTRAQQLEPSNPRGWFYRASALLKDGRYDRAIRDFDRAIELAPNHGPALLGRGSCYEATGHKDAAARDFRDALNLTRLSSQRFVDDMGMIRTQADRAFHLTIGEARDPALTEEEWRRLQELITAETPQTP